MNAAARLVHQRILSRHLVLTEWLTWRQALLTVLVLSNVLSAFGVIYTTHLTRDNTALFQSTLVKNYHLRGRREQLLLERSTLMVQAHIEHLAATQFHMVMPDNKSVVIIHE
jgi:cell division protein FtsL